MGAWLGDYYCSCGVTACSYAPSSNGVIVFAGAESAMSTDLGVARRQHDEEENDRDDDKPIWLQDLAWLKLEPRSATERTREQRLLDRRRRPPPPRAHRRMRPRSLSTRLSRRDA